MTRSWMIYKDKEVKDFGSGFQGLESYGLGDSSIRYDFGDKKVSVYLAVWSETGLGGRGWQLSQTDFTGNYQYSSNGELSSLSHDRITVKTYTYYKPSSADEEYGYSMVFEPGWSPPIGTWGNSHQHVTYYDSLYREDGQYQFDIDQWSKDNPSAEVRDLYNQENRHLLLSSEEGFTTGFEDGWWNDVALKLNPEATAFFPDSVVQYLKSGVVIASTWSDTVRINLEKTGSTSDSVIQAKQVDKSEYDSGFVGSIVTGSSGDDIIRGLAGFDQLFGKAGDDLIHGGNGRDIIDGGSGSDELHGDFGWNTYKDQQDGSKDLIAIKSDQHLSNFWYGKAGNSPNGEKADFIEGLDATDEIKIIGAFTPDISVVDNVTARGVTGIGIYAKGTLEAVYTGGNLSTSQIQSMTTGDGSTTAMNNQMWSYWGDNTFPPLQA